MAADASGLGGRLRPAGGGEPLSEALEIGLSETSARERGYGAGESTAIGSSAAPDGAIPITTPRIAAGSPGA